MNQRPQRSQCVDEPTLLKAACADPAAFGALYHRYLQRVYSYVCARTDSMDDADDLTQQIFLQALDALPLYRGNGPFAAWLFRIARNVVINLQGRRRVTLAFDHLPEALHPRTENEPEAGALQQETVANVRELLAVLSPEKRELLALRFAARLTVPEIAVVIGKSPAATEKRLARTLQALQERYNGHA